MLLVIPVRLGWLFFGVRLLQIAVGDELLAESFFDLWRNRYFLFLQHHDPFCCISIISNGKIYSNTILALPFVIILLFPLHINRHILPAPAIKFCRHYSIAVVKWQGRIAAGRQGYIIINNHKLTYKLIIQ